MKQSIFVLFVFILFAFASELHAQHRNLTVILLRHAEKDLSDPDELNPPLTLEGRARARKLTEVVKKYQPDAIYSSNFIRTRSTVEPWARERRRMIQLYDHRNLRQIADLILSGREKRIIVVGHNNTTPALANLLLGENRYKSLGESEYDKIWIIKIRRNKTKPNKIREKIIQY